MRHSAGEEARLASLSLTHVFYNPSDPISHACAFVALIPQSLCVAYATFFWCTRELEVLMMFAGQMLCELLNLVLKRIIREERPPQLLGRGYGMPSSHSQFAGFFAVYLALFLLVRHQPYHHHNQNQYQHKHREIGIEVRRGAQDKQEQQQQRFTSPPTPLTQRLCASVLANTAALLVCASRVYLNYHSTRQVVVGWSLGVACAVLWFWVTAALRRVGLVDAVLNSPVCHVARVRDLMGTEDVMQAGWVRWNEMKMRKVEGKVQEEGQGQGQGQDQEDTTTTTPTATENGQKGK